MKSLTFLSAIVGMLLAASVYAQTPPSVGPVDTRNFQSILNNSLSAGTVTATGGTTNSLATWMSYLAGTSNPNNVVFGGTTSVSGTGTFGAGNTRQVIVGTGAGNGISTGGTNSSLSIFPTGTGGLVVVGSGGGTIFAVNGSTSAIANNITIIGQTTGNSPKIVASGTDSNISMVLQATGTGSLNLNAPTNISPGSPLVQPGGTNTTTAFSLSMGSSGILTGTNQLGLVNYILNSDTTSQTGTSWFLPFVNIQKNWGNGTTQGNQSALRVSMTNVGPVSGYTPPGVNTQMGALQVGADYQYNLGGTSLTAGYGVGAGYSIIPYVWLHPGATYYAYASNAEWDLEIDGSEQVLTLGGTVTVGDTITVTFTSSSISGSPVSVACTAASGNTIAMLVKCIDGLVMNSAALANAGISGRLDPSSLSTQEDLFFPQQNTVTIGVAVAGSATETASLGSIITGSSAIGRDNMNLTWRGSGRAINDYGLRFGTLNATPGGTPINLISIGVVGGTFPVAPGGNIMSTVLQKTGETNNNFEQAYWSPQLAAGIDLHQINFTTYSGYSLIMPGAELDGTGALFLHNAKLSASSTGLAIDVAGNIGSGNPAIVSGGGGGSGVSTGNYYVGDIVQDANGGQYQVTAVNGSTGAVTSLTTLVQPYTTGACWGTGLSVVGGSGSGLTISPTCGANNIVYLQPSGGTIKAGSGAFTPNGSVATTMTSLGPAGSHTTIQEWFTVTDSAGTVRYIPAY